MAINLGDINNNGGKAKIGNEFKDSEIDSDAMDITAGNIQNEKGDLDVGNRGEGVKARKPWVWGIIALGAIAVPLAGYYFNQSRKVKPQIIDSEPSGELIEDAIILEEETILKDSIF